jgi:hypothetical protein
MSYTPLGGKMSLTKLDIIYLSGRADLKKEIIHRQQFLKSALLLAKTQEQKSDLESRINELDNFIPK